LRQINACSGRHECPSTATPHSIGRACRAGLRQRKTIAGHCAMLIGMERFIDRSQAGRLLAREVAALRLADPVVLALPRGGVPVAAEVARQLNAPLDLLMVRKIGAPQQPELAVAAVVDGARPEVVIDDDIAHWVGADRDYIDAQARRQLAEIERRRALYLRGHASVLLAGKSVVLVDDGIATGTTVRAALKALRRLAPARIVLAVPVAAPTSVLRLRDDVDDLICLSQPPSFRAVGLHYDDFHQVEDEEVIALLDESRARSAGT
jgi:putative phosphoribosyl transferase